ncbi:MAG: alanine--tRNA ligase [Gammaproteobacteria bacterium]|nr:alanine--tRNA ligase [Gammaproteobacteria bacterium]
MKTAELRQLFLDYFARHQHTRVASSSLVPGNDPTLLFTNAGMVQFKDVFLGNEKTDYLRATTSQRCVRAGGKHNDLENVGYTARHHTFFEMLGNFSFGDYFKREAINFAWQFLTEELGLNPERLWITVFEEDSEAEDIWLNEIGVSTARFSRIGEKDNFWSMGDVGPCGPCSEIFYDHGEQYWGGPPGTPEEDGDRYIEIWNLVFMQYDRLADGTLKPLPKPSVDTGMGLERVAAVMQRVNNNYEIDLFDNLIAAICEVLGTQDRKHHSVRVIADHIRSCSFLIADGVLPSNEGRGYVLRRIIRRAIRHGYQVGGETPFFYKLVAPLVAEMGEAYPELTEKQPNIETALKKEELRFAETLEQGLKIFEQKTADLEGDTVSGELVFLLYDTYGFPADLTADVARERDLVIDQEGFEVLMEQQRARARSSSQFANQNEISISVEQATEFIGYNHLKGRGKILALQSAGSDLREIAADPIQEKDVIVVLDSTPFYAEGGGQVGDIGTISANEGEIEINDCRKLPNGAFMHIGKLISGSVAVGEKVSVVVNPESRYATAANHSATHLMHAALKLVLGSHVMQKGSLVSPDRLRFDFSHDTPLTAEQITEVEGLVNAEVFARHQVQSSVMPIGEAKAAGAEALFGEKYGDEVRVISMGDFSLELCGGTHVANTAEIGFFKIIGESGIAAGVRRIEALTRNGALSWVNHQQSVLQTLAGSLKSDIASLPQRLTQLQDNIRALEADKKKLQEMVASGGGSDLQTLIKPVGDVKVLATVLEGADTELLRSTIDKFKDQHTDGIIVLGAEIDNKVKIMAGVAKAISKKYPAGKLIQTITGLVDGRGGGRPDMAEGGIPDAGDLEKCLEAVTGWVLEQSGNA